MKMHQAHSRIIEMKDQEGNLVREYKGVKHIIVKYFYEKLFSAPKESFHIEDRVDRLVKRSIIEEDVLRLSNPVTEKEIEDTMLSMKRWKEANRLSSILGIPIAGYQAFFEE
ncbi:hypothetical protein LIER_39596 [Lithospermum erythrorhizon]|uniref:Uncharacterized protein n=1 Tax=Lithospermum erythrorhizon TaxID=34254 RepID=A0AAV3QH83_LITER